jgi:hypothetical protein
LVTFTPPLALDFSGESVRGEKAAEDAAKQRSR